MMNDLLDRFFSQVREVSLDEALSALRTFVNDPTGDPRALMIGVAIVVLAILVVVLFLLYVLMSPKRKIVKVRQYSSVPSYAPDRGDGVESGALEPRGKPPSSQERPTFSPLWSFLGSGLGITLIMVTGFAVLYGATSTDSYCYDACHALSQSVIAAHEEDHASCAGCHERPGFVGVFGNTFSRARMVITTAAGRQQAEPLPVGSLGCVRCHDDVLDRPVLSEEGVAVSHKEIVDGGDPCTSCHVGIGHGRTDYVSGMAPCVVCHDAVRATSECSACHVVTVVHEPEAGEPIATVSESGYHYTLVNASRPYCDDCHDVVNQCDPCHGGIRMPHDDDFIGGGHARSAAFERKAVCWNCHTPERDCGSPCHRGFRRSGVNGHPPSWRTEHGKAPRTSTCGCHQWYSGRRGPMCPLCH
ncbi:MAG: cytochrome c3 family protein [Anaerosomatales bacterium]|nr:cytochrome c3 family protein [Anaerosomatales bacterium]MDT8433778.1 cytochrome c3 family protein [Anaerosomatales bacterium]